MKRIQLMIPDAIEAARSILVDNDGIKSEYNGYISSFGASIISAGLLPSVIFYSQEGDSEDRRKIITCIQLILQKHGYDADLNLLKKIEGIYKTNANQPIIHRLTDSIFDASIALKLAIRTFPKYKKGQS